jgi:hypothetical protein
MVHLEREGASSFDLLEDIERVPPTSREMVALLKCTVMVFTEFAVYRVPASKCHLTRQGIHVPGRLLGIESVWLELGNGNLVCLRGDLRGSYCEAGRVACASA